MNWKQRNDYPLKSRGKTDFPGAKGSMGIPEGARVPKASVSKGSDYPGKKGDKGKDLPKSVSGAKAPRD